MGKPQLTIELVPKTLWYANLRKSLSQEQWDELRRRTYKRAGYHCEICGGRGPKWPVECHEIWEYDDKEHIQYLRGLVALCPDCHEVKHIGYAKTKGRLYSATEHLQKVNGWNKKQARLYIFDAFVEWDKRSEHKWTQDLSWLEEEEKNAQVSQDQNSLSA